MHDAIDENPSPTVPNGPQLPELGKFIFPFTKPASDRDQPIVTGTGILLAADRQHFVATAAHVLDQDDEATIYLPDGVILEVDRTAVVSTALPPSGRRGDDKIDLAVFRLTEAQARGLAAKNIQVIPTAWWAVDDVPDARRRYVFTGFPDTRTRVNRARQTIAPGGISANCLVVSAPEIEALGCHEATHIGVRYDRERMADDKELALPVKPLQHRWNEL